MLFVFLTDSLEGGYRSLIRIDRVRQCVFDGFVGFGRHFVIRLAGCRSHEET